MKRFLRGSCLLLSALALSGGLPPWRTAAAAADAQTLPSLSGILALPDLPELPARDPFSPPGSLLPATRPGGEQPAAEELPPLQLTAIVWGADRASAVVNGTIVRPGDRFLGMRVLSITRDQVHFQRGEGKLSLILHQTLYNTLPSEGK